MHSKVTLHLLPLNRSSSIRTRAKYRNSSLVAITVNELAFKSTITCADLYLPPLLCSVVNYAMCYSSKHLHHDMYVTREREREKDIYILQL